MVRFVGLARVLITQEAQADLKVVAATAEAAGSAQSLLATSSLSVGMEGMGSI